MNQDQSALLRHRMEARPRSKSQNEASAMLARLRHSTVAESAQSTHIQG
jgi:hypothetical protein